VYEHIYKENVLGKQAFGTHYVVPEGEYVFSVVGTSRCDVRAACSGATPSNASVARIFVPPATARAGTAQRAIPTIALNTDYADETSRDDRAPHSKQKWQATVTHLHCSS